MIRAIAEGWAFQSKQGGEIVKVSARNVFKGKVKRINHGAVNSEIIVGLPGGLEIVSVITKTATGTLQLAEGKEVYAIVKASNVFLGVD